MIQIGAGNGGNRIRATEDSSVDTLELVSFQEPIFNTIQGEGTLMGTPSTFIRLQGCNQTCEWCDTKDSWLEGLGTVMPVGGIIDKLQEVGCLDHVVITGGNPMLQSGRIKSLLSAAFFRDKHITIETNTFESSEGGGEWEDLMLPHLRGVLWSLSPKLHKFQIRTVHRYLSRNYLGGYLGTVTKETAQIKVVVQSPDDIVEAGHLFRNVKGNLPFTAILQPEWSTMRKLTRDRDFMWAVGKCASLAGQTVRVLPQAHKTLVVI